MSIVLLFITISIAAENRIYTVKDSDTLDKIAAFEVNSNRLNKSQFELIKLQLVRFNPHVSDWNQLPEGLKIFLNSPLHPHLSSYTNSFLLKGCAINRSFYEQNSHITLDKCPMMKRTGAFKFRAKVKNVTDAGNSRKNLSMFGFYVFSLGEQVEKKDSAVSSIMSQNSPFTIGLGGSYRLKNKNQIVSSGYLSKINPIVSNLGNEEMPYELGMNIYYQFNFKPLSVYFGLDYEKLSSINSNTLIAASNVTAALNDLGYLTVGIAKVFFPFERFLLFKASASYLGVSKSDTINHLTGYKYIFFSSLGITKKLNLNLFLKRHKLKDQTDITVTRYGLGVSYSFL